MKKIAVLKLVSLVVVAVCATSGLVVNGQTHPDKSRTMTTDVKIRQRMGPGMETVLYIKGQRMRSEMAGDFGITTILQCDLKRTVTINEKTKTYMITPTDSANTSAAISADSAAELTLNLERSSMGRRLPTMVFCHRMDNAAYP